MAANFSLQNYPHIIPDTPSRQEVEMALLLNISCAFRSTAFISLLRFNEILIQASPFISCIWLVHVFNYYLFADQSLIYISCLELSLKCYLHTFNYLLHTSIWITDEHFKLDMSNLNSFSSFQNLSFLTFLSTLDGSISILQWLGQKS